MTTSSPIAIDPLLDGNVTTKSREEILYQSSGAIVAAIVVGVIALFTVILLLLKMYNRRMRTQRELEPKNPKNTVPSTVDHNSHTTPPTLIRGDIHMQNRRL